jgi:predicted acylesterase/phospholipase RssA
VSALAKSVAELTCAAARPRKRLRSLKACEAAMAHATDFETWHEAAGEHDRLSGADDWRADPASDDYDYALIASRIRLLKRLRRERDVSRLVFYLREELHGNLGNMANPALYSRARLGTKHLVTEYLDEVVGALDFLCDTDLKDLPPNEKFEFFKRAAQSFGRSGLLLTGGATRGLIHVGVIQELWREGLLPRVLSGSSAGSLVAGIMGTHTDEELHQVFDFDNLDLEWSKLLGLGGIVQGHGLLDGKHLRRSINRNIEALTFQEAYERTKRIVNVSVSPADPNQFPRLMNYLTAPNVFVRTAVLASTAIPGVFPPVQLKARNFEGKTVAYMPRSLWIDGSVHADVPKDRINRLHNVNHYIVSQTNPHVVPFMSDDDRRGLLPFLRQLALSAPIVQLEHLLEVARRHFDISPLGTVINKAHAIASQPYSGDVTIFPERQWRNLLKTFSNPTAKDIDRFILAGKRAAWPKLERIRNTTRVSRAFDACLQRLRARYRYVKRPRPR